MGLQKARRDNLEKQIRRIRVRNHFFLWSVSLLVVRDLRCFCGKHSGSLQRAGPWILHVSSTSRRNQIQASEEYGKSLLRAVFADDSGHAFLAVERRDVFS